MIVFTELEILFALWLLFVPKRLTQVTWLATLGLFSFFTCVTVYKSLIGAASCGCFGRVEINPWYTLVFDLSVVGLLLWFRPKGKRFVLKETRLAVHFLRSENGAASLLGVSVVWLILCIPSAWSMVSFVETDAHNDLSALGQVFEGPDGKPIVVLEPEKWVGKQFPLLDYIETNGTNDSLRERLSGGEWNVFLVHRSCSDCQSLLKKLCRTSDKLPANFDLKGRIAIIELPDEDGKQKLPKEFGLQSKCKRFHFGRLQNHFNYFAKTPVELKLVLGWVIADAILPVDYTDL